jgi:hypothetical protein
MMTAEPRVWFAIILADSRDVGRRRAAQQAGPLEAGGRPPRG